MFAEQSDFQGTQVLDMLVVGGGINGVGIARDAAGRGLSVRLVEKGDLAAAASSASSKLMHGGLRYCCPTPEACCPAQRSGSASRTNIRGLSSWLPKAPACWLSMMSL